MCDTLSFISSDRDVILKVTSALLGRGLYVVRSFDLRGGQVGLSACACHRHAVDACDCQLVVLLVYGRVPEPLAIVVSGHSGHTEVRVATDAASQPDPGLSDEVCGILSDLEAHEIAAGLR